MNRSPSPVCRRVWLAVLFVVSGVWVQLSAAAPVARSWEVAGVKREGLIAGPEKISGIGAPLVFVFHGHGGSAAQVARSMPVHEFWPEAVVVYLQGLPTPGQLTDPAGRKAGWQKGPGAQDDRDLKFFDHMRTTLAQELKIDPRRIYATGHSNGGGFTYLLWATRREVFAAFGPSAAVAGRGYPALQPAPVIHVAGTNDRLVKYSWQEAMIARLKRINGCTDAGVREGDRLTRYASPLGAPVVTYLHEGGHRFPKEATQAIVTFFQSQTRE